MDLQQLCDRYKENAASGDVRKFVSAKERATLGGLLIPTNKEHRHAAPGGGLPDEGHAGQGVE
jgi:hypothetical protein